MKVNINKKVNEILREFNYTKTVPVQIDGKMYNWTETKVRAFQVYLHRNPEKYKELTSRVIIYGGHPDVDNGEMRLRKDAKFAESFITGFYDIDANLIFEVM